MDKREVDSSIDETNQCEMGMMNGNNSDQMSEAAPPPVQMVSVEQPQQLQQQDGGVVAPPDVHQGTPSTIGSIQAAAPVAEAAEAAEPPLPDQSVLARNQGSNAANNPVERYNRNDNLIRGIRLLSRVWVGNEYRFECPSCHLLFESSSQLVRHMKLQYPFMFI